MQFQLLSNNPMIRDPQICPFGVYLVSSLSKGGSQGFYWFQFEIEAVRFLQECMENAEVYDEFEDIMSSVKHLHEIPLNSINEQQTHFTIRWCGHFESLFIDKSRFAREIRNDYQWVFEDPLPYIEGDNLKAFIAHLGKYAERYRERGYVSGYRLSNASPLDQSQAN